jgi:di/tricarboxylate transporter
METGLTLTGDMMLVLTVLVFTIALFVFEVVRVDVVALSVMVLLGLLGLVPSDQLFSGFASNAVISIIAVMILGAGLDRTGVMTVVASFILRIGGKTANRIIPLISGTVGGISSLIAYLGAHRDTTFTAAHANGLLRHPGRHHHDGRVFAANPVK